MHHNLSEYALIRDNRHIEGKPRMRLHSHGGEYFGSHGDEIKTNVHAIATAIGASLNKVHRVLQGKISLGI